MYFKEPRIFEQVPDGVTGAGGTGGAPADGGQGGAEGEGAGEGTGEGTGSETPTTYGGFETPEALAAEYEKVSGQVKELESLKGRQGTELGELRTTLARLEGELEAYKSGAGGKGGESAAVDLAELERQYDNGEITLAQFLTKRDAERDKIYDQRLKDGLTEFQREQDDKAYAAEFIRDNPGYVEAYNAGRLADDIAKGLSPQHAWDRYQLRASKEELESLKEQSRKAIEEAEKKGAQKGARLEKGSEAAAKVLGEGQGSFAEGGGKTPRTHSEQVAAGVELIQRMRSGGG